MLDVGHLEFASQLPHLGGVLNLSGLVLVHRLCEAVLGRLLVGSNE